MEEGGGDFGGEGFTVVLSCDLAVVEVFTRVAIEIGGKKQRAEGKGKDLVEVTERVSEVIRLVEVLSRLEIERAAEGKGKLKALEEEEEAASLVSRGAVLLPHDLVSFQVLARLPVESLMRFKSVSKLWRSTISDPSFSKARAAGSRSRHLFVTYQDSGESSSSLRCCFFPTSTLPSHGESVKLQPFTTVPIDSLDSNYDDATQVVNGLVCLYAGNRVSIFNISTREIMNLPCSHLLDTAKNFVYYFGFAPISKEYKLVKSCSVPNYCSLINTVLYTKECHILALSGGNDAALPSWRRLSRVHSSQIFFPNQCDSGFFIDGALCFWHVSGRGFLILNCQDESFQQIDAPPLASSVLRGCSLLQFRGHFALASGVVDRKVQLWVLKLELFQGQPLSYEWTNQVIIDVPCDFPARSLGFSFLGNLPTGEMLFSDAELYESALRFYSYDHTKGKFEKFKISMFRSSKASSIGKVRINYCEEDITPLSCSFAFRTSLPPQ